MLTELFPVFGLRVTTPRLELRLATEDELPALAAVAAEGVHEPGYMPFLTPWTDFPPPQRARNVVQWYWRQLSGMKPGTWGLPLTVFIDGAPVGLQEIAAEDFAVTREVSTGSWLGLRHHGQGIGTEMRAAILHLAFAGLGAREALSQAFDDNAASLAVSRKLGYEHDGLKRRSVNGVLRTDVRLRITREVWEKRRTVPVEVHGLGPCLPDLGLSE